MITKLEAKTNFEKIIKSYLEKNASETLIDKINSGNKTLAGFYNYAKNEARAMATDNCACVEDATVFGWAIHYFEEDSIKEGVIQKVKPITTKPKKQEKNTNIQQLSLFDL